MNLRHTHASKSIEGDEFLDMKRRAVGFLRRALRPSSAPRPTRPVADMVHPATVLPVEIEADILPGLGGAGSVRVDAAEPHRPDRQGDRRKILTARRARPIARAGDAGRVAAVGAGLRPPAGSDPSGDRR